MGLVNTSAQCPACGSALSQERRSKGLCPGCVLELALESPSLMAELEGTGEEETLAYSREAFAPGQVLGSRYRIRSLLGRGGMGEVWRAFDLKLRVDVALKAVRRSLLANDRALEALRQEVRSAREVVSPNVCRIYQLEELDGHELVSMEYVDGTTLLEILRSRGPLELAEAREIAAQFLAGLEAIHLAGLVHRDVKPENLMVTGAGRVVVMDFGIAKGLREAASGTISGTAAYMAPEQAQGQALDPRADVFSAGVVLAEMIAPEGIRDPGARQAVWQGVHHEPPEMAETPWAAVLQKAVSHEKEQRFPSASALARALEEVTLRAAGDEDLHPYPGLASFSEEDAEYFFGRELEVEEMWKKLRRPHLLALMGPSGAGKSSFLRAGLLPVTPAGWRALVTKPGTRPFMALSQTLVPELAGDAEAMKELLRFEEPDVAVAVVSRWRQQYEQALVIIDQFEELFTQNPPEIQQRFADLLSRLALEADVHVLLAMRDDFLFHCTSQQSLTPIFSELTPLKPLSGAALRRALVQPALKCGYRFEEDSLADEMVGEVETERGALPLLAFAAARLWTLRDREQGLLTRQAYEHIGGVGGALAQHAEATLEKIGQDKIPVVRELFRNLVTSEGTRATREREELLSVFLEGDRPTAGRILAALIDARLLTSYELSTDEDEGVKQQRIEIIHESLLSNWPRLVRWQTQDADSAQLRDQLRQAAQMWAERGRPGDLLWTGTSFKEFELWRERYAGGLSDTEEHFAGAMKAKAERRKRQRRLAVAAILVVALAVATVTGWLWRQSEAARRAAEAAEILARGRLQLENYPTAALAHAIASLELADNAEARRFALEALWRGPTAFVTPGHSVAVDFSPDGRWLATGSPASGVRLWSRDGGPPKVIAQAATQLPWVAFAPGSDLLVSTAREMRFWSVPEGLEIRQVDLEGPTRLLMRGPGVITYTTGSDEREVVRAWPLPNGEPRLLGSRELSSHPVAEANDWDIDPSGELIAYAEEDGVYLSRLEDLDAVVGRLVGKHRAEVLGVRFHPAGDRVVAADKSGEIRFWPLTGGRADPERILQTEPPGGFLVPRLDPSGRRLIATPAGPMDTPDAAYVWDLAGPPDAEPLALRNGGPFQNSADVHPKGSWLVTGHAEEAILWPLNRAYPHVLRGQSPPYINVAFTPDGEGLVSASDDGTVRFWPLSPSSGTRSRILMEDGTALLGTGLSVHPTGKNLLTLSRFDRRAFLVPLEGGEPRPLPVPATSEFAPVFGPAFSPDGRLAAFSDTDSPCIRIVDLESGETRTLDSRVGDEACGMGESFAGWVFDLAFLSDRRLLSGGTTGLRLWSLEEGTSRLIRPCRDGFSFMRFDVNADGRHVLLTEMDPDEGSGAPPSYLDLQDDSSVALTLHGNRVISVALDPSGRIAVTGDADGVVRVDPLTGEEPHLLLGHEGRVGGVAVSPDGRWIASGSDDGTIRLWPMPDLDRPPLHSLPQEELLAKLHSLTNLRLVEDEQSPTGYKLDLAPFPGWKEVPTW